MAWGRAFSGHRGASKPGRCPEIENSPWFRSKSERNVFRALRFLYPNHEILYEKTVLRFPEPYRRALDYKPDFAVTKALVCDPLLVEVKGWLDGKSKTRLLGFKKYYADLVPKLLVITEGRANREWIQTKLGCPVWDLETMKRQLQFRVVWE